MEEKELFKNIVEDKKNGLTYKEIAKKYNLGSNYLIKKALGKKTGSETEYAKKYTYRLKTMKEDLKHYNKLRKDFHFLFKLFLEVNTQLNIIKQVVNPNAKIEFKNAQDVYNYLDNLE